MHLVSTLNSQNMISWRAGVLQGIAPDGGLLMPERIPRLSPDDYDRLAGLSFPALAYEISRLFLSAEVPDSTLADICSDAFTFDVPLREIAPRTHILELFHGPTCAFKDFGARFMSRLFRFFLDRTAQPLTVLVATSGDTGGAVAHAFFDPSPHPLIRVALLFPKGKISDVQERQMTTLAHNISAFEVDGSFDDCQALVKQALTDAQLCQERSLTSANSINIARLLPQIFYYVYASLKFPPSDPPLFVVPSGNLGNLTGGLIGQTMGMRTSGFIAACNMNAPFPEYLQTGVFTPRPSRETLSNAMDVGAPSNFSRILTLGKGEISWARSVMRGESVSDHETVATISSTYRETNYRADPHTAVGLCALKRFRERETFRKDAIVLATAHPAKFSETVKRAIGSYPEIPPQILGVLDRGGEKIPLKNSFNDLRAYLLAP